MTVASAALVLTGIWCSIYLLHYAWSRKGSTSLLPTILGSNTRRSATNVSLKALQLRVSTTRWNTYHDSLSTLLERRGRRNANIFLRWFYNIGSVLSAIGMLAALGGLVWMCGDSAQRILQKLSLREAGNPSNAHHLVRRMLENTMNSTPLRTLPSRFSNITPIIPGVTVPISDLPIIVLAVFLSQIVHELGHAIAAARESLPMITAGVSFTVCIPAAFVSFPVAGMKSLAAQARSRVTAAGPFHNLAFWCFLALITRLEVVNIVSFVSGYRNISNTGKIVVAVSVDSPLSLHLSAGSIITKLDDKSLASSTDIWTEYLMGPTEDLNRGWCVQRTVLDKSDACCSLINNKVSPFACFVSQDHSEQGCIDPVPIMTKHDGHGRCTTPNDCPSESVCAFPHKESQLMRLTVRPSILELEETVVLWNGPRIEVWEEVQVGNWLPRIWFLPLWFSPLLTRFWEYVGRVLPLRVC
ncbi:hypothetical protein GALMADRAFT_255189 [Galerina marginata CBS 339.88]|uniref:Endopeptidase S2P n=1 Tax=Galerina marginata (strain CBS 339.88) TaxID=685588 RepID=A0A067SRF1_GALM3|nr:hypothetical protein GALMADRAFT_255189 [Galerina marginata CBS 339.88]